MGTGALKAEESRKIAVLKKSFRTRSKWSKQDYSDFYFRDVSFLLKVIDRLTSDVFKTSIPKHEEEE